MRAFVVGITLNRFVKDSTLRCLYLSVTVDRQSADAEEENRLMIASAQDRRLKTEKHTRFYSILVFEINSEGSPQVNNNGRFCHVFSQPQISTVYRFQKPMTKLFDFWKVFGRLFLNFYKLIFAIIFSCNSGLPFATESDVAAKHCGVAISATG